MKKTIGLIMSHLLFAFAGFALGIYLLPILIAPDAPDEVMMESASAQAMFQAEFKRDLKGSDFLHWGEGLVSIGSEYISLQGSLAPGPDYKLYLSPKFVQTDIEVKQYKASMVRIGDVKTFENFVVAVPDSVDPAAYTTVLVWCETFEKFISAAKYQ